MALAAFTASDFWRVALGFFLVVVGLGLLYALLALGGALARLSNLIKGAQQELIPILNKAGGTIDRVNGQLDKVDQMTDSAVDAVEAADSAVRAVSFAVVRPVQKLAGLAAGVSHGAAAFRTRRDWRGAVQAGKEAAARRERDLAEELDRTRRHEAS